MEPKLLSLNSGRLVRASYTDAPSGGTGIGKTPVEGAVMVSAPGPRGVGGSGLSGDVIGDMRHHGGDDQAVYSFAREDLDEWEGELNRPLRNGVFGENLTTVGVDVNGALIGERWRVGGGLLLEVTSGRIPCRTFAGWMDESGWIRRWTRKAAPGAYLRVIEPGEIRAGDSIDIVHRPDHDVTVAVQFRASTTERELLARILTAGEALHSGVRADAEAYIRKYGGNHGDGGREKPRV
ncbi:MOSC domain-containing protein [Streptomyces tsukubensis]|uniref:MOSC domain-containing protein n=1 Tax=Streptomyces tsukubensis TaxID=83656 RepID=A0A1V4A2U7_9ACTN|nr:MOSC domain-containing protein [Streptomyces tsukubensis]OON74183.1 MOSC domain-containing protein [Streptomyces tsukubensis]QFR95295.1 MOSC domain-containing protein [Streptomyces tsukubensis]